jgi:outer membrane protein assembly factor BamB
MRRSVPLATTLLVVTLALLGAGCEREEARQPQPAPESAVEAPGESVDPTIEAASEAEPMEERVASRPARSLEIQVSGGLRPERLHETRSLTTTDPAVWGDVVIAGDADGLVRAWALEDGAELWRVELEEAVAALAADASSLFIAAGSELRRVSPVDGEERWSVRLQGDSGRGAGTVTTRLTASATALYLGLSGGTVASLSREDGSVRWSRRVPGTPVDRVVVADGVAHVALAGGDLYAFSAPDGERLWSHRTEGTFASAPAYAAGRLAAISAEGDVVVLDSSGSVLEQWRLDAAPVLTAPIWHDEGLVCADGEGAIRAFEADGSPRWEFGLTSHLAGIPARLGDILLLGESTGGAVSLDLRTGEPIARVALGAAPVGEASLVEGVLYWVLRDGSVRPISVNAESRQVPLFTSEGSWVLPESGTFRLRDERVSLRMRSERDAVFEITVSAAPSEELVLRVVDDDGTTVATNMGKVTLERSIRAPLDAGVSYELVVSRPDATGEITISIETIQLQ